MLSERHTAADRRHTEREASKDDKLVNDVGAVVVILFAVLQKRCRAYGMRKRKRILHKAAAIQERDESERIFTPSSVASLPKVEGY